MPSLPDADLRTPPWIVPWLRSRFLPGMRAGAPRRRLYVGRGDTKHTRRVDNEAALLAALDPLGFEAIDPGALSPAQQVPRVRRGGCIVGPHGAGLTNLAFASPGAAVVEIFAHDYVNECFWALATTVPGLALPVPGRRRHPCPVPAEPRGGLGHPGRSPSGPAAPRRAHRVAGDATRLGRAGSSPGEREGGEGAGATDDADRGARLLGPSRAGAAEPGPGPTWV